MDFLMLPASASANKNVHTVLAETVAQPQGGAAQAMTQVAVSVRAAGASVGGPPAAARTTVLPRIDVSAGIPQIVFDGKERFEQLRLLGEGGLGEVVGALDHDI